MVKAPHAKALGYDANNKIVGRRRAILLDQHGLAGRLLIALTPEQPARLAAASEVWTDLPWFAWTPRGMI